METEEQGISLTRVLFKSFLIPTAISVQHLDADTKPLTRAAWKIFAKGIFGLTLTVMASQVSCRAGPRSMVNPGEDSAKEEQQSEGYPPSGSRVSKESLRILTGFSIDNG